MKVKNKIIVCKKGKYFIMKIKKIHRLAEKLDKIDDNFFSIYNKLIVKKQKYKSKIRKLEKILKLLNKLR